MIKFITELKLINLDNGYYRLAEDFVVDVHGFKYLVPKGFRTNLANTPKCLHSILPPDDPRYINAAVLHDYLYSGGYRLSRAKCDKVFYDVMVAEGNSVVLSFFMYLAVRMFGSSHYKH